jgi:hypothetical protein
VPRGAAGARDSDLASLTVPATPRRERLRFPAPIRASAMPARPRARRTVQRMPRLPLPPALHEPLGVILGTRAKVALLRAVILAEGPRSQRHLAWDMRLSPRAAARAVDDLLALGILLDDGDPTRFALRPNREHVFFPALHALVLEERALLHTLTDELRDAAYAPGEPPPLAIALVGAAAVAEEDAHGALEVLVLGRTPVHASVCRCRVQHLAPRTRRRFGVALVVHGAARDDGARDARDGVGPWRDWLARSRPLAGPPLAVALGLEAGYRIVR